MPFPVPPSTFRCPQCNWKKTIVHKSDVLLNGHSWFEFCPVCNYKPLKRSPASMAELTVAKLRGIVGK